MQRLSAYDTSGLINPLAKSILRYVNEDGIFNYDGKLSGPVQYEALSALCSYKTFAGADSLDFDIEPIFNFLKNKISEPDGHGRRFIGKEGTILKIQAMGTKAYAYYMQAFPRKGDPDVLLALLKGVQYMLTNGPIYKGVLDSQNRLRSVPMENVNPAQVSDAIYSAMCISQVVLKYQHKEENKQITSFILDSLMNKDFRSAKALLAITVCLENKTVLDSKRAEFHSLLLDNYSAIGSASCANQVLVYSELVDYLDASLGSIPTNLHVLSREVKEDCISKFHKAVATFTSTAGKGMKEEPDTFKAFIKHIISLSSNLKAAIAFESFSSVLPDATIVKKLKDCAAIWDLPISHEQKLSLVRAIAKTLGS